MAYDGSSLHGDEVCDFYYDLSNNFMNPESPLGFFVYKVVGGVFDWLDELVGQFRIDLSILDASVGKLEVVNGFPEEPDTSHTYFVVNYTADGGDYTKYEYVDGEWVSSAFSGKVLNSLDTFWGKSYNLERPVISYTSDGVAYSRLLSDTEYSIYLYLRNHQLLTMKDLLVAFSNAFGEASSSLSTLASLHLVNHKYYDNPNFSNETLEAYDPTDTSIITDRLTDADGVDIIIDRKTEGTIVTLNIPNGYDEHFLSFLEEFISIKGNVVINQGGN